VEIINYYYQWQILKPSGKRRAKRRFTVCVKTPKGTEEAATLKDIQEWLDSVVPQDKNEPSKASISRFNLVSTAEFECGAGLQTEEYIFCDCKLYEDQSTTVMDILPENSKMNTQSKLLRLEKNLCKASVTK
jgi:hypothetical protein